MGINIQSLVAQYIAFWQAAFPEQGGMSRAEALASTNDAVDGLSSKRPDAAMAAYQDRVAMVYGAYEPEALQAATMGHILNSLSQQFDGSGEVVSLGCGPASYELWLAWQGFVRRVTLVDHSPKMLKRACFLAEGLGIRDRVTTVCADSQRSGLAGGSADIVFSINAMHWSAQWRNWVKEAARILRTNGSAFLSCTFGAARSQITTDQFVSAVQKHFETHSGGYVIPPKATEHDDMATVICRIFAAGTKNEMIHRGSSRAWRRVRLREERRWKKKGGGRR